MAEHKIESNIDCFGTIDMEKKDSCKTCDNNKMCEIFKPKLAEHKAQAEEKGRLDYVNKITEVKAETTSKYSIYGIIVTVLLVLLWMLVQESTESFF
ncbi:MAG: hypothetical protein KAH03_04550 [Cocleimonas sp.]|nr:hypothetical protein [Cocleimonas sp.]